MAQTNHPSNLLDRILRLERQLSEVRKKVGLSSATISRGGLTILNDGFIEVRDTDGDLAIAINPEVDANFEPRAINFYSSTDESFFSRLQGFDNAESGLPALRLTSGRDTDITWQTAYLDLVDDSCYLYWGNPTITDPDDPTGETVLVEREIESQFRAYEATADIIARFPLLDADASRGNDPGGFTGVLFRASDTNGDTISRADLQHRPGPGGSNDRPNLRAVESNIGLLFGLERMYVVFGDGETHGPLTCSSLTESSSRDRKRNIRDVPYSAVDAVRRAPSQVWEREQPEPDDTTLLAPPLSPRDDPTPRRITLRDRPPEQHIGPMAEDLPPEVVRHATELPDEPLVDHGSMIGLLWRAVQELADRLDAVEAR